MEKRNLAIQPDYKAWESVQIGMTRDEVLSLLGKPPRDPSVTARPYVTYGCISFRASPHRRTYRFMLGFNEAGRVFLKSDPFNGVFSPDGKPSKPQIIFPQQNARFGHYPRVLDVRWNPCSGIYPIRYTLEVGLAAPGVYDFHDHRHDREVDQPYVVIEFPGSQPGRIRIRGQNEAGIGEWSDYRFFDFSAS